MNLRRVGVLLVVVAASACAALKNAEPPAPRPRPGVPIQLWKREARDYSATTLLARNDTTVSLIASFKIFDCVNIKEDCSTIAPTDTLQPGEVFTVATLSRLDAMREYSFNYSFAAR
jgi:hypothetical protein